MPYPLKGTRQAPAWSKAVEVRSYVTPPAGLDGTERSRGLTLVKSNGPQRAHNARWGDQIFSPAEMRHNFAIWPLRKAAPRSDLHLYYCVRCKWAFSVDRRGGAVTPVDSNGQPILGHDAADRLTTFSGGPCPVFRRLASGPHTIQKVAPIVTFPARLAALILAVSKAWKSSVWARRHRPRSFRENPHHRSKRG